MNYEQIAEYRSIIWFLAILVAIAVIGFGAYLFFRNKDDKQEYHPEASGQDDWPPSPY